MELDALISEILAKVQERVAALEAGEVPDTCGDAGEKPKLLIIAQEHGDLCHPTLESTRLAEIYQTDCMLLLDEEPDLSAYEGVIAYTLTNEVLGKIANGILDTPYTKAFGTALLLGKKIFIPEEEVELYKYKDTAPKCYYNRIEKNLCFLKKNGVTVVPNDSLIDAVMGVECEVPEEAPAAPAAEAVKCTGKTVAITKKVITERDVSDAKSDGAAVITVKERAILTDLAKEYARRYGVKIERTDAG